MKLLNSKQYDLFNHLVSLNQKQLHKELNHFLSQKYETVICEDGYTIAVGDIPIALVAHMDTVYPTPVKTLYYDREKNVMWSPNGLGADDRAGIFAILQIIKDGLRPSVIFTEDEEVGGTGATDLAAIDCPIPGLKYLIELDRQGAVDCVFYDCNTKDFIEYVETFGFKEAMGTFSDISILCPAWEICGVNLSIGYHNEHSYVETLNITEFFNTIEKVKRMLTATEIPDFEFEGFVYRYKSIDSYVHCAGCKKLFSEFEVYDIKTKEGKKKFCMKCIADSLDWCEICGEAFENVDNNADKICDECREALKDV